MYPSPGTARGQVTGPRRAGCGGAGFPVVAAIGKPSQLRRVVLVVLAGLGLVLAGPPSPAYAHAQLVGTTPANGARLATAPAEIVLVFSERVNLVQNGVRLLGAGSAGSVPGVGPARIDPANPAQVRVPLPAGLGEGGYTVSWRVVSADSHPIHGAFAFAVGNASVGPLPDAAARTDADSPLSTVFWLFRWLGYAGLALLAGGVLFLLVGWPRGWTQPRPRRLLAAGWLGSLLCALAMLLLQGPYGAGGTLAGAVDPALLGATLVTDYGRSVLARLVLLAVAGALLLYLAKGRSARPVAVALGLVVGLALPATWVGTGHANAQASPLAAAADTVHLAAMATWFGGLVYLIVGVLPAALAHPVADVAVALRRFSRTATGCVAALVVTGTYQAWRGIGSLAAISGSPYGTLLVFKLAAVGVLLWFGAMSRSVVQRRYVRPAEAVRTSRRADREREQLGRRQLRRSVRAELAIAVAVLGVTSVLVATPPASRLEGAAAVAPRATPPELATTELALDGGGRVAVRLAPARVGASALTLAVRDASGRPWDVPEVSAAFRLAEHGLGPLPVALRETGPGEYGSEGLSLPVPGRWRVQITVRTSEIDQTTVGTDISVA